MTAEMARKQTDAIVQTLEEYDGDPYDYASDAMDVRRTYDSDGTLRSVSLLVAFGGPNIWVTFYHNGAEVSTTWYCDPETGWADCPDLASEILTIFDYWTVTR